MDGVAEWVAILIYVMVKGEIAVLENNRSRIAYFPRWDRIDKSPRAALQD